MSIKPVTKFYSNILYELIYDLILPYFMYHKIFFFFFQITVTASYAVDESQDNEAEETKKTIRVNKRDAIILMDNFPMDKIYQKPKLTHRRLSRISQHRYGPPVPSYGPPRAKYGLSKLPRKPIKKYRGKIASSKYRPQIYKRHSTKPKYGPPKHTKFSHGPPNRISHFPLHPPASAGFAEPPSNFDDYHVDTPIDSYGELVRTTLKDLYPTVKVFKSKQNIKTDDFTVPDPKYQSWKNSKGQENIDIIRDYSKTHPVYMKPEEPELFVTPVAPVDDEENLNSYSDIYMQKEKQKRKGQKEQKQQKEQKEKRRKPLHPANMKLMNWPLRPQNMDPDEEIIVGGQYAEPPARYIPKSQINRPSLADDEFAPPHIYIDSEIPSSATNSPYVNYKSGNLAFTPQNLNDVFSIAD